MVKKNFGLIVNLCFIVLSLILLSSIFTCAPKQMAVDVKTRWETMSPKEKTIWMFDTYNSQYIDYMLSLGFVKKEEKWVKEFNPILSDAKKEVLKQKKEILNAVYPMIKVYDATVGLGKTPSAETELEIIRLLEKILLLI